MAHHPEELRPKVARRDDLLRAVLGRSRALGLWTRRALTAFHRAPHAVGMTPEEKFLFDLEGYLIVRAVLGADEIAELTAIARQKRAPAGETPTAYRVFGASSWGPPYQALIDHPRIVPYLIELVGPKFRLDHDYAIFMTKGGMGPDLHSGAAIDNPDHSYTYRDGIIRSGLTVAMFCLTDASAGDGGFCCIPGSHKSNFLTSLPADVRSYRRMPHYMRQPSVRAGDAIVFTEALVHGTAPWTAGHERLALLYKYSPGHSTWMGHSYELGRYTDLTAQQKRILAPPSVGGRPDSVGDR